MKRAFSGVFLALLTSAAHAQSYDDLAHKPDQWRGRSVSMSGRVIQSLQDGQNYTLRVNVTPDRYGWKDTVMVIYPSQPSSQNRIVEGDVINFRGLSDGIKSYQAVLGQTIQLPFIVACDVTRRGAARFVTPGKC